MAFYVAGTHALGIHGQYFILDFLGTGLVLTQQLQFKFALTLRGTEISVSPKMVRRALLLCPFRLLVVSLF